MKKGNYIVEVFDSCDNDKIYWLRLKDDGTGIEAVDDHKHATVFRTAHHAVLMGDAFMLFSEAPHDTRVFDSYDLVRVP